MKLVINTAYGGIFPETAARRTDPQLIADVESGRFVGHVNERWGHAECLRVVEIPDEATDYQIFNYDGTEMVVYVLGGKLAYIPRDTDAMRMVADN